VLLGLTSIDYGDHYRQKLLGLTSIDSDCSRRKLGRYFCEPKRSRRKLGQYFYEPKPRPMKVGPVLLWAQAEADESWVVTSMSPKPTEVVADGRNFHEPYLADES
jgi:hypothetical protein